MSEVRENVYEALFLFPQSATSDMQGVIDHIGEIFRRAEAETLALKKWDERRMAYEIKKHKRGLYILGYIKCDRSKLVSIERDCNLSERILRTMVTRADHLTLEEIQALDERQSLQDEANLKASEKKEEASPAEPVAASAE